MIVLRVSITRMEKVDVAIQSYKKPESLIYSLLSLKKYCGDYVDTIWIDDDLSGIETTKHYTDENFISIMSPIKIKLRVNKKHYLPGKRVPLFPPEPKFYNFKDFRRYAYAILTGNAATKDDVRYQWAINNTKADKLYLMHDDILYLDNIIKLYLDTFRANDNLIIVGDLGQCNRCEHRKEGCTPSKIMDGIYPSKYFPLTKDTVGSLPRQHRRACRINEWSCMLDVKKTRSIKCCFGNYVDDEDVGAYWFEQIIKAGYDFCDPLPLQQDRSKYYIHCWQGHSGHSVWVDQGSGIHKYQKDMINKKLLDDFGYKLNY